MSEIIGPNGERITVEEWTPADAEKALESNTANYRKLRRGLVERYARDMAEGRWRFTADTIKFDTDGLLADGQNRLTAQVKVGITLHWAISRDMAPDATMVMDSGGARKTSDHLAHIGIANAVTVASIARLIISSDAGRGNTGVSTGEITELVAADATITHVAVALNGLTQTLKLVTKAVLGFTWWRLHGIDPYRAAEFFARLESLNDLEKNSPILALHRRLLAIKDDRRGGTRAGREECMAVLIYAWNAWIRGELRTLIKTVVKANGTIHMPDPLKPLDVGELDIAEPDPQLEEEPEPPAIAEQLYAPGARRRHAG